MGLFHFVVHRPVAVAVLYSILMLFGLVSLSRLPIDMLPEVDPPVLTVLTPYPGASALDVEGKVTERLEDSLGTVAELEQITSISRENLSIVTLKFGFDTDLDQAANDVRQQLDVATDKLPRDIERPRVLRFDPSAIPVLVFVVSSKTSDVRLQRDLLEDVILEPLRRLEGVGAVTLRNAPERRVRVDVDRQRLVDRGLTISELAAVLGAENLDIPAGDLQVGDMEFGLRMPGEATTFDELRSIPLSRSAGGGVVTLGDVAEVRDGLEDSKEVVLLEGRPVVAVAVQKVPGSNTVEVASAVVERLEQVRGALPAGMRVDVVENTATFIERMIFNLKRTVGVGGFLVILVVGLFVRRLRPSLVVAATIPTSLVLTFLVLYAFGFSLNAISLIAMALAIGMVVDNGVVVLENITRLEEGGMDPLQAAEQGAREVGSAITASTTTTLVIFLPMVFVSGMVGKLFGQLALVMIATITGSLVVALTLTPSLAARLVRSPPREEKNRAEEGEASALGIAYGRTLDFALRHPAFILAGSAGIAVGTLGLLALLGSDYLPQMDTGDVGVVLELPVGTGLDRTVALGERVVAGFEAREETELVWLQAGSSSSGSAAVAGGHQGSNVVKVQVRLVPGDQRELSQEEVARAVLDELGPLPEARNVEVLLGASSGGGLGLYSKPVVLEVLGSDLDEVQDVATRLREALEALPGLVDISAGLLETRPEMRVQLSRDLANRAGVAFGLAGRELRMAMTGVVATRFAGGGDPRDVVVRLREQDRDDPTDWRHVPVRSRMGSILALGTLATLGEGVSPIEIRHVDKSRVVTVSAGVEGRALGEVGTDVDALLRGFTHPPTVTLRQGGAVKDQRDSFADLGAMLIFGLLLVYLVMAAQFESWLDPFVIMFSVPFAATGAFLALLITGTNLSITGSLGLIILIGVVVNNAIVLVDCVKLLRAEGTELVEAVRLAGRRRLRPVLITTLTTMGGMLPLALARGDGAELWGPMGRTALGGLAVSTGVTLLLVPVIYVLMQRLKAR